jgi:di/tripeptidase
MFNRRNFLLFILILLVAWFFVREYQQSFKEAPLAMSRLEPLLFNYISEKGDFGLQWQDHDLDAEFDTGELVVENAYFSKYGIEGEQDHRFVLIDNDKVETAVGLIKLEAGNYLAFPESEAIPKQRIYQIQGSKKIKSKTTIIDAIEEAVAINNFTQFLEYASLSCMEGDVARLFIKQLKAVGVTDAHFDDAVNLIKKNKIACSEEVQIPEVGNVVGTLPATHKDLPSLAFSVHLDGVPPQKPGVPIPWTVDEKKQRIVTDGTSILRADNAAGLGVVLTTLAVIRDLKIPHGDIYITGLIGEETAGSGAKVLDQEYMQGDLAFVIDGTGTDEVLFGGADIYTWVAKVKAGDGPDAVSANNVALMAMGQFDYTDKSFFRGDKQTRFVATGWQGGLAVETKKTISVNGRAIADHVVFTAQLDSSGVKDHLSLHEAFKKIITQKTTASGGKATIHFSDTDNKVGVFIEGYSTHPALQDGVDANGLALMALKAMAFDGKTVKLLGKKLSFSIEGWVSGIAVDTVDTESNDDTMLPNQVYLQGQMRPLNLEKSAQYVEDFSTQFKKVCDEFGATCEVETEKGYLGFRPYPGSSTEHFIRNTYLAAGIKEPLIAGHFGGSNANVLFPQRGTVAVLGTGVQRLHSTSEYLDVPDYLRSIELLITMVNLSSQYQGIDPQEVSP